MKLKIIQQNIIKIKFIIYKIINKRIKKTIIIMKIIFIPYQIKDK